MGTFLIYVAIATAIFVYIDIKKGVYEGLWGRILDKFKR